MAVQVMPISVIVPLAKNEQQWLVLTQQLQLLPADSEVILVAVTGENISRQVRKLNEQFPAIQWKLLYSPCGRGRQLNCGAAHATYSRLWFLHADSQITQENIDMLFNSLAKQEDCLFYFDLYFYDKTSCLLNINELAAKWRSNLLGLPFGDQGFFLSKAVFARLGGYVEDCRYGEDHLLVWQAKQQGIKLSCCPCKLATSARKYHQQGWLRLTLRYQCLWLKQAIPQLLKCFKIKWAKRGKKG
jgi:hypothetical protein